MSKNYQNFSLLTKHEAKVGRARAQQQGLIGLLEQHFEIQTLQYLDEKIIDHLLDSLTLENKGLIDQIANNLNDYSLWTAPAYKALEGYLFQIAKDLSLTSSGRGGFAGSYFIDEEKLSKHIDKLLKELESKTDAAKKLSTYEKRDIKDRVREMKAFLQHYRNTPSHFFGERIDTPEKAKRNVMIIFGAIDNTTKILLNSKLIQVRD